MARSWVPTAFAAGVALILLWLAGAPLERPHRLGGMRLVEPAGSLERFPRRFVWQPVAGAETYEITVAPAGGAPLFRQRGTTNVLELAFEPGAVPGPGDYLWEVAALRRGRVIAQAAGSFRVREAP